MSEGLNERLTIDPRKTVPAFNGGHTRYDRVTITKKSNGYEIACYPPRSYDPVYEHLIVGTVDDMLEWVRTHIELPGKIRK